MTTNSGLTDDPGLAGAGDPTPTGDPMTNPAGIGEPPAPEPSTESDWTSTLDDETREYIQGKGYKDPGAVAKSAREAEAEMNRLRAQKDELEGAIVSMLQEQEGGGQKPEQDAPDPSSDLAQLASQLGQAIDTGDLTAQQGLGHLMTVMNEQLGTKFESMLSERLSALEKEQISPLNDQNWQRHHQGEVSKVRGEIGDARFNELKERAAAIVKERRSQDDGAYYREDAIRSAFAAALLEKTQQDAKAEAAQTLNGGGAPGSRGGPDPAEAIMSGVMEHNPAKFSGGMLD